MKKLLLLIASVALISSAAYSQQVPRDKVVVEIGTGTWCPYCPGSAMGANDLIENGYQVAVIEYHNGDDYTNTYSNARNSYYNITGFPTAYFDGGLAVVGGSNTESMFPYYAPKVNQRMAILSSFTIELTGTHACLSEFTAHITVNKVAASSTTVMRLHTVLTESEIIEAWQGQSQLDYVERLMAPSQSGTAVNFSSGDTQEFDITFTVDPTWVLKNCEVVVFLQDNSTREIFQATKMPLMDFTAEYDYDASVEQVIDVPVTSCTGIFEPSVDLRNLGGVTMNSVEIFYQVNNGTLQNYNWSGSLVYMAEETVNLPPITFTGEDNNELIVYTSSPNGNQDQCQDNDSRTVMVPIAMHTPNTVKLILRTDNNPEETTWELKNSAGDILYQGGPYSTGGEMVQQTFTLEAEDCFTFIIHDTGGDGIILPGFYMLYYGSNTTIYQGGEFGYTQLVDFNTADAVGIEENAETTTVSVYPNPVSDKASIDLQLSKATPVTIAIYAITGQKVLVLDEGVMESGMHSISIDASAWNKGIYMYRVTAGEEEFTGKLNVR